MADKNELTIMFFFAVDNPLSPLVVSQVKAIKEAGFHENAEVIVYFDSNEKGVPTRVYNVNDARKRDSKPDKTRIGDGADPFIHRLSDDEINFSKMQLSPKEKKSQALKKRLERPDQIKAVDALSNFIGFCREKHPARHYILILTGHGLIVGNDAFLPDEHPVSAIKLKELDGVLREFAQDVKNEGDAFEVLAMHSCSMSAVEVAYQLSGTANFMIASEGISYVGSWPYRQLMKKIFNSIEEAKETARAQARTRGLDQEEAARNPQLDVETMVEKLYSLTLFSARDYTLSGYSLDLSLCSLDPKKVGTLTQPIQHLVARLKDGLNNAKASDDQLEKDGLDESDLDEQRLKEHLKAQRVKELILLAHWESQSYWQEEYTDLYDFCRCLRKRCDEEDELQGLIKEACDEVIQALTPKERLSDSLVIRSDNFGSEYQYSHGLSVYFPWCEPIDDDPVPTVLLPAQSQQPDQEDTGRGILENYGQYTFTTELKKPKDDSWLSFLKTYFKVTKRRKTGFEEEEMRRGKAGREEEGDEAKRVSHDFNRFGPLASHPGVALEGKVTPSTGAACACPKIKNYPTQEITDKSRPGEKLTVKAFSISEGALDAENKLT
jgi:hypothetical protein